MSERARILKGVGGLYTLVFADGSRGFARGRGLLRKQGIRPLPGDWVQAVPSGDCDAPWKLLSVEPRQSDWIRPPLANLDALVLVVALQTPSPHALLLDRFWILAASHHVNLALAWTKTDLPNPNPEALAIQVSYSKLGIPSFCVGLDPAGEQGTQELLTWLQGRTAALAGASGVGKSTLLNRILGADYMETGQVQFRSGRGKHTTRHVEFFSLGTAWIADTPGFTSLDLKQLSISEEQVILGYPELAEYESGCRFAGCRHLKEPGCAVRQRFEGQPRFERYCQIRTELLEANR